MWLPEAKIWRQKAQIELWGPIFPPTSIATKLFNLKIMNSKLLHNFIVAKGFVFQIFFSTLQIIKAAQKNDKNNGYSYIFFNGVQIFVL